MWQNTMALYFSPPMLPVPHSSLFHMHPWTYENAWQISALTSMALLPTMQAHSSRGGPRWQSIVLCCLSREPEVCHPLVFYWLTYLFFFCRCNRCPSSINPHPFFWPSSMGFFPFSALARAAHFFRSIGVFSLLLLQILTFWQNKEWFMCLIYLSTKNRFV